ncbi:hypothetical protein D1839_14680 [Roseburia sp. 1XD42-34]|nr:hypothetical protein [Roseburia sp. 1XD42-34]RKI76821.1 hypothetical protein D7V87_12340 [Clostridium sp. 1xD42-85]
MVDKIASKRPIVYQAISRRRKDFPNLKLPFIVNSHIVEIKLKMNFTNLKDMSIFYKISNFTYMTQTGRIHHCLTY